MQFSLKLDPEGEVRCYVLQDTERRSGQTQKLEENECHFLVVKDRESIKTPLLRLHLSYENSNFEVESQDTHVAESVEDLRAKLDELAIQMLDALQQGKDLAAFSFEAEEKPYNPELIRVDTKHYSIRQIYDMLKDGDLILQPDFQRNLVWDEQRKSRLIESVLLRIPLPMFYFAQDEEGVLFVVDGLQRLSAITDFMDNKINLKGLEYLTEFEGASYKGEGKRVDARHLRWFNQTQLVVNIIDPQSPSRVKFDIFRRINTGGRPLNAQEMRHCLTYEGLRDTLKHMAALESFKQATGGSVRSERMEDRELALRFITFRRMLGERPDFCDLGVGLDAYSGNMDETLNDTVEKIGKATANELFCYETQYDQAMRYAAHLFGSHAFRKVDEESCEGSRRSIINKALFASFAVALSYADESKVNARDHGSLVAVLSRELSDENNREYNDYLSYGTNGKANLKYAFKKAGELIRDLI